MYIRKILQRRDAMSVVLAIVLGLLTLSVLGAWASELSSEITRWLGGSEPANFDGRTWQDTYIAPTVMVLVQLAILEAALRILVPLRVALVRRKK